MNRAFRIRHAALRARAEAALGALEAFARQAGHAVGGEGGLPFGLEAAVAEARRRDMVRAWALLRRRAEVHGGAAGGPGGEGSGSGRHGGSATGNGSGSGTLAEAFLRHGGVDEELARFLRRAGAMPFSFHAVAEVNGESCLVVDVLSGAGAEAAVEQFTRRPRPDDVYFGHGVVLDGIVLFLHAPLLACGRMHGERALCRLLLGAGRVAWALRRERSRAFDAAAALHMAETLLFAEMRHCVTLREDDGTDAAAGCKGGGLLPVAAIFRPPAGQRVPPSLPRAVAEGLELLPGEDAVEARTAGAAGFFSALPRLDEALAGVALHLAEVRPA